MFSYQFELCANLPYTPAALLLRASEKLQLQEVRDPVIVCLAQQDNIHVFHGINNVGQAGLDPCSTCMTRYQSVGMLCTIIQLCTTTSLRE